MPRARSRVVLDTNILLSAILFGGTPGEVLDLWQRGLFELVMSPELLAELLTKLRFKFDLPSHLVVEWERIVSEKAIHVLPDYVTKVCRDPDDNKLLDTSLAGRATYLVTGDEDLLSLKTWQGIRILKAADFLRTVSRRRS
ncbi:MAG: putative toxin-antitoxin system toxin component, PIN family [Actinomycetota bacterium]